MQTVERKKRLIVAFALTASVSCMQLGLTGCSGGSSTGTTTGTASTTDCSSLSSGSAIVNVDTDNSTALTASAVTSNCDEVAVYSANGTVKQVAIVSEDGEEVVAEFDDQGQVVAVRSGADTLSVTYNDSLGFARTEFESGGESSASIFAIDREVEGSSQRQVSGTEDNSLTFCDELEQFGSLMKNACANDPSQPYCGQAMEQAGDAVRELCSATIQETGELRDSTFGDEQREFELGVDGFVTARPATGDSTTFVLAAVAFGGVRPHTIEWSLIGAPDGADAPITQLPGGAAIADATTDTGRYEFKATVTDAEGLRATDEIAFEMGDEGFIGAVILATKTNPEVGENVDFSASRSVLTTLDALSPAQADSDEPTLTSVIYWDFGDGTSASGVTVSHTYTEAGVYTVTLIMAEKECDYSDHLIITVGDGGDRTHDGEFGVAIVSDKDSLSPGDTATLTPEVFGAIEPVSYGWGIINDDGSFIADLVEVAPTDTAQFAIGERVLLEAFEEGLVQVGVLAIDATGRVAEGIRTIPIFGDEGGLFVAIEGPFELASGTEGKFNAVVIGGDGTLTFEWYIEDDPFSSTDDNSSLASPHGVATDMTAGDPGFVGIGLIVTDSTGRQAEAFYGVLVFREGDLILEYLGPFDVPVGQEVPLFPFIDRGDPPYFCAWASLDGPTSGGRFTDPFACDTFYLADFAGCTEVELYVEDVAGKSAVTQFGICAGDFLFFDCPIDDFCDPQCEGFDPDCGDPCPFDGFCDESCPIGDPDCFDDGFLCQPDDGFCDDFCEPEDSDCGHCAHDGICVFNCFDPDPDCERDFCIAGDGFCDFGCFPEDPDCADLHCQPDDGFCDIGCESPDPDCGRTNDDICFEISYCCEGDSFCDIGECPQPDVDCDHCGSDGICVEACHVPDPDCDARDDCGQDGFCNPDCFDFDPDCFFACDLTFACDPNCPEDPDCLICDVTFGCDPNCPNDPDCVTGCDATGNCDPNCPDGTDCDPGCDLTFDCDPNCPDDPDCVLVCDVTSNCDPNCPDDPDCSSGVSCAQDGVCDVGCVPFDLDCSNLEICGVHFFCCDSDGFCDSDCPQPDPECNQCAADGTCVFNCAVADPDCTP